MPSKPKKVEEPKVEEPKVNPNIRRFRINPESPMTNLTSLCHGDEIYLIKGGVIELPKLPQPCWYTHLIDAALLIKAEAEE
ncbi:MAG: hypothetical protein KDJ52_00195 [Anaerolineae bacterium]|nr:hypothetical protein [Anaerolineae bacterium]